MNQPFTCPSLIMCTSIAQQICIVVQMDIDSSNR